MIVADTAVWIAHLRGQPLPEVQRLRDPAIADDILIGDIVMTVARRAERQSCRSPGSRASAIPHVAMVGPHMAAEAASNYRILRSAGFTLNKIANLFIGTYCIEHGRALLRCDTDFQPMARLCRLQLLR